MSSNCGDILSELTNEEIDEFREFYKNLDRLDFVHVHLYLKNQLQWNEQFTKMNDGEVAEISDRCKMKFYRPRHSKLEYRTLIGITGDKDCTIFVHTLEESLIELRECLETTDLIKWGELPMFVAVHQSLHKMMYEVFEFKNFHVTMDNRCSTLWMCKENALSQEVSTLEGVAMKLLLPDDHLLINELWRYKYPGSQDFIKSLINLNGGLGIYEHDKLISWILQVECYGLGLLQTVEDHQGKGFARFLTRAMTKRISEEFDEDVILFASYQKPKTVELYVRYGFKHVSFTHWFRLKKN